MPHTRHRASSRGEEFYRVLADVTAAATGSLVLETAMEGLARVVVPRVADWCTVHVVEHDGGIRTVAISHADPDRVSWAEEVDRRYGPSPDDAGGIARVLRTGRPEVYAEIGPELLRSAARDDQHLTLLRAARLAAAVLTPLTRRGEVLGVLTLLLEGDRRLSDDLVALAGEVARRAAVALENARLFAAADEAKREAEATNRTLERLLEQAPTLGLASDERSAAAAVARAAREAFHGGSASVWRFEGEHMELLARIPEQGDLRPGYRVPFAQHPGFRQEVSTSRPSFVPDIAVAHPELVDRAREVGARSLVRLPLVGADGPAGVVVVSWPEPRPMPSAALLALGQRFADLAALAMEDARRRRSDALRRLLHLQLEASLMPRPRIDRRRLRVLSRYRSGEQRMMLGGDFLDAYQRADGGVRAVIGDVSGQGPVAAALAASLRAAWRVLTRTGVDQAAVLATLHELVEDERDDDEMFATVCSVEIDPDDGAVRVASAGHPPPILLGPDQPRELQAPAAPPLGAPSAARHGEARFELPREWALLLYTDGLVEGRADPATSERYGAARLLDWLGAHVDGAELSGATLDALLVRVDEANGRARADDTAVLALVGLGRPTR